MEQDKYQGWKNRMLDLRNEIETEIVCLFDKNQINGFLRPEATISAALKNGDTAKITLIERKGENAIYYAGPVPYSSSDFTLEGINELYQGISQSIQTKGNVPPYEWH